MRTIATTRVVLAIVGVLFLLVNPAGVCAGTPDMQSPAHPCCPKTPAHSQQESPRSCVCIDRQPAAPQVTDTVQSLPASPVAAAAVLHPATLEVRAFESPVSPPHDRSVEFHQLLV